MNWKGKLKVTVNLKEKYFFKPFQIQAGKSWVFNGV